MVCIVVFILWFGNLQLLLGKPYTIRKTNYFYWWRYTYSIQKHCCRAKHAFRALRSLCLREVNSLKSRTSSGFGASRSKKIFATSTFVYLWYRFLQILRTWISARKRTFLQYFWLKIRIIKLKPKPHQCRQSLTMMTPHTRRYPSTQLELQNDYINYDLS